MLRKNDQQMQMIKASRKGDESLLATAGYLVIGAFILIALFWATGYWIRGYGQSKDQQYTSAFERMTEEIAEMIADTDLFVQGETFMVLGPDHVIIGFSSDFPHFSRISSLTGPILRPDWCDEACLCLYSDTGDWSTPGKQNLNVQCKDIGDSVRFYTNLDGADFNFGQNQNYAVADPHGKTQFEALALYGKNDRRQELFGQRELYLEKQVIDGIAYIYISDYNLGAMKERKEYWENRPD